MRYSDCRIYGERPAIDCYRRFAQRRTNLCPRIVWWHPMDLCNWLQDLPKSSKLSYQRLLKQRKLHHEWVSDEVRSESEMRKQKKSSPGNHSHYFYFHLGICLFCEEDSLSPETFNKNNGMCIVHSCLCCQYLEYNQVVCDVFFFFLVWMLRGWLLYFRC